MEEKNQNFIIVLNIKTIFIRTTGENKCATKTNPFAPRRDHVFIKFPAFISC